MSLGFLDSSYVKDMHSWPLKRNRRRDCLPQITETQLWRQLTHSPVSSPAGIIQQKTRNSSVKVGLNFDCAALEGEWSLCLGRQHLNTISCLFLCPDRNLDGYKCRKLKCRCFIAVMTSSIKTKLLLFILLNVHFNHKCRSQTTLLWEKQELN